MINILFCGNEGIFDGILTCMLSALMRNDSGESFSFYVLTMDVTRIDGRFVPISKRTEGFLDAVAKSYGSGNSVRVIDVTDLYERTMHGNPNEKSSYSPYALTRLLSDLVPEIPGKILYCDADVLFNLDSNILYGIDVSDVEYAAARDHYGKFLVNPNFINSGVLLLNMDRIRSTGLFEKARKLVNERRMIFPDEIAIIKSTERKRMLPQRFNDQKFLWKHTVVRHFSKRLFWFPFPHTENIKQWRVTKVHKVFGYECFDDILYEYIYLKRVFESSH
ncbi:MAG: lipopolysaccharide biosynthesis protein [Treponema sp.]|nr:lipopolysaccharide biosynthesis protein [Treponema sp.]